MTMLDKILTAKEQTDLIIAASKEFRTGEFKRLFGENIPTIKKSSYEAIRGIVDPINKQNAEIAWAWVILYIASHSPTRIDREVIEKAIGKDGVYGHDLNEALPRGLDYSVVAVGEMVTRHQAGV